MIQSACLLTALCGIFLNVQNVSAASPSVTAVLNNSEAAVGEMVQLEIKLSDASGAAVPNEIHVDGLEIHQTGTSHQFEMHNMTTRSSVICTYTILPLKTGTFKIPPQTIHVGNSSLQTPELTLHVSGPLGGQNAQSSPGTSNSGASNENATKLAFAELLVPKKTAYVGEMVPVVIRLCFATRGKPTDLPAITAQGFTVQKLVQPEQTQQETMNGRQWEVYSFKTAIAATRPGKFDIGPIQAGAVIAVPRRQGSSRSRSPFDIFSLDDPFFSDPFFRDPFSNFTQQQRITFASEPVVLEIKPLPADAPPGFSGAVGNFTMTAEAKPTSVQVGDPITVTAAVSGRGNFDRVNAPVLEDEAGWHKYPPSAKFKQDDEVGISGQKTFETVLSPNEKRPAVPPLIFSYFDPLKERYETLRSDPVPIKVEGGTSVAAAAPSAAAMPGAAAAPPKAATPPPRDILYQLSERPAQSQSFTPLYAGSTFWLAQLIPLLGLTGWAGWKIRQARLRDQDARRIAGLQHEIAQLTRQLRRSDISPDDYFPHASRLVQIKTALAKNVDPNVVDLETAARAFALDVKEREQLQRIFEQSDELRYSGAANGHDRVPAETRNDVLHFIESLRA
jgi:BatD DUF11 like domain